MESLTRRSPNPASSDNENTFTELSCERAAVYGLLARLCREEIDRATFDELKRFQNQSPRNDDAIGRGLELIGSYVNAENECENDRLTELAVDFARVFIGHGTDGHSAAYPYESVYTSDKRLIMQQARKDVAGIYASYGVKTRSSWGEGEDHLATELEFMQILCLKNGWERRSLHQAERLPRRAPHELGSPYGKRYKALRQNGLLSRIRLYARRISLPRR